MLLCQACRRERVFFLSPDLSYLNLVFSRYKPKKIRLVYNQKKAKDVSFQNLYFRLSRKE